MRVSESRVGGVNGGSVPRVSADGVPMTVAPVARPAPPTRPVTPAERRSLVAVAVGCVATGLNCGMTADPNVNLVDGIAVGAPAGLATFTAMTVVAWLLAVRRG